VLVNEPRGVLRVAVPTSLGRQYIVPALPRFAVQYPMLKVLAIFGDSRTDIVATGVDAALCIGPAEDASLAARRVFAARFVTCASPDYLSRNGTPRTPAELDGHDCLALLSPSGGAPIEWGFEKNQERITFVPQGRLAMSDGDALVDAAVSGAGIVTVLDVLASRSIASGVLRPILTDWQGPNRHPISVVYRQQRHLPANVRVFADFVAGLFPRRPPTDTNCSNSTPARNSPAGRSPFQPHQLEVALALGVQFSAQYKY
jgi:LysR family transcriptional regulator for bpeEF and oprC